MTVVIDPAQGALAQAFGQLGTAIANRVNATKIREKELAQNPETLARLAPAARRAIAAGQGEAFAKALNVRPEFVQSLIADAFQPDTAELTDIAFRKGGGVEATVGADIGTKRVTEATTKAQLGAGLPGLIVDNQVSEAILQGRGLTADLLNNIPELTSQAKADVATATSAENAYQGSVYRRMKDKGLDRLTVDLTELETRAKSENVQFDRDTLQQYKDRLDSLDPNSHEYQYYLLGMQNPAALSHLTAHEQMGVQEAIANARNNLTPLDILKATKDVQEEITRAREYLRMVEDDKDSDQDVIEAARTSLNNWSLIGEDLANQGVIRPIAAIQAVPGRSFTGRERGVEFTSETVQSDRVNAMLQAISSGEATYEDLSAADAEGKTAMGLLTPIERQQLTMGLAQLVEKQKESEALQNRGSPERLNVIQRRLQSQQRSVTLLQSRVNQYRAQATAAKTASQRTGYTRLAERAESALLRAQNGLALLQQMGSN